MLNINNYSFTYKQLDNSNHPMMPALFEVSVKDLTSNVIFGTKFQHPPGVQPDNAAVFNAFCNKDNFKNQWWIENIIEEKTDKVEKIEELAKIKDNPPEINIEKKKEIDNPPPIPDIKNNEINIGSG